jgi:hypothetical protein
MSLEHRCHGEEKETYMKRVKYIGILLVCLPVVACHNGKTSNYAARAWVIAPEGAAKPFIKLGATPNERPIE